MPGPARRPGWPILSDAVYVTYPIPSPGLELLRKEFDVRLHDSETRPSTDEIATAASGCAGLLTLIRDPIDAPLMDRLPGLRAIANYGVGYDNVDVGAATARGIMVTNTPDVLTDATADLAFALLLAAARRLGEGERMVRAGKFEGWTPKLLVGADLVGATLGLVGYGRIAAAVGRRALGFGMRLIHTSHHEHADAETPGSRRVTLDEVLAESDFVSIHVPLTDETRHLIDAVALGKMKPTAYLINTARGPIVDEAALAEALAERRIAGAGLDVYEREPEVHAALLRLDNVVLLPHIGSATVGARAAMSSVAATNLTAALSGRRPPNLVNPEVERG
jgi:glyoxylate reductase